MRSAHCGTTKLTLGAARRLGISTRGVDLKTRLARATEGVIENRGAETRANSLLDARWLTTPCGRLSVVSLRTLTPY